MNQDIITDLRVQLEIAKADVVAWKMCVVELDRDRGRLVGLLKAVHGMFGGNDLGSHLNAEIAAAIAECEREWRTTGEGL